MRSAARETLACMGICPNADTLIQPQIKTPTSSSAIKSVGYSSKTRELDIVLESGAYRYSDVSTDLVMKFLAAPSKGQFFQRRSRASTPVGSCRAVIHERILPVSLRHPMHGTKVFKLSEDTHNAINDLVQAAFEFTLAEGRRTWRTSTRASSNASWNSSSASPRWRSLLASLVPSS
jgi:hypothetical protein